MADDEKTKADNRAKRETEYDRYVEKEKTRVRKEWDSGISLGEINQAQIGKNKRHAPKKRDYAEDIEKYARLGIPPRVFIDSIMTVFLDCRKASTTFFDELTNTNSLTREFRLKRNALASLKKDYNIHVGTIKIPAREGIQFLVFFFKDASIYNTLDRISDYVEKIAPKYRENPELDIWNDLGLNKELGNLLGYPECCMEHRRKLESNGKHIEDDCAAQLIALAKNGKDNSEYKRFSLAGTVFFTFEFYPCSPYCKNAAKIDEKISTTFKKEDKRLLEAYKYVKAMNILRTLNKGLDSNGLQALFYEYNHKIFDIFYKREKIGGNNFQYCRV
jgi:hypothetical protein